MTPVFTLTSGPPASLLPSTYLGGILGKISPAGTLPLEGPDGTSQSRVRPTVQRLPTLDAWNATIQRQVTSTISVEIAYIGNKGTHMFNPSGPSYNPNEPAVGNGTNLVTCAGTAANPVLPCGLGSFNAFVPQADRRRFFQNGVPSFTYPGYTTPAGAPLTCCAVDLAYFGNDASSNYNSLQAKVEKRFSNGFQFIAHYTYSHSNAFDQNYYDVNPKIAYGPDQYNRNQVFLLTSVYELPFGRGKRFMSNASRGLDYVIGGWQVSNTLTWSSGLPWTATIGECGEIADVHTGSTDVVCRPNLVAGQSVSLGPHTVTSGCATGGECGLYYFTPIPALAYPASELVPANAGVNSCSFARPVSGGFALPACGTIGNAGFDTFTGPRAFFSDLSLSKNFRITERITAQFRFDAYNVFNHPVLGFNSNQGNTCIDCSTNVDAGRIDNIEGDSSPGSPIGMRQLQFGLRVKF
jgi:hypothetical protein